MTRRRSSHVVAVDIVPLSLCEHAERGELLAVFVRVHVGSEGVTDSEAW